MRLQTAAAILLGPALLPAARLTRPAESAFDSYIAGVELRLANHHAGRELPESKIRVEPVNSGSWPVSGGRLHHWRAAALVPGVHARATLALLRDYDNLARYYAPEVVSSRALSDHGDSATVAMRFKKQRVITVVMDAGSQAARDSWRPDAAIVRRAASMSGRSTALDRHRSAAGPRVMTMDSCGD